ncbi:MAG TPA: ParB/RepB/Spo0J family partition protein [Smithella sp.]|nr:ParB/RepB/Spo0J family partition protein [Smithella sp.]MDM7985987.1 ParB/RepB/Spo0J family partition protein [Smithella sp.]HNY49106.1 ParB/RepB/Spo0J family partition protein [Smithella sp.]HOG90428.1 ParB/RepB/Spo0J family partition protein [Smithella sp.]HOU51901.1 ParB/RepB/Spo0J family partition protein [Smithella sp.]
MAQKNVLGKGLGAIFPDLLNEADKKKSITCGIEELRPNRYQPRKIFSDDRQKDLIASIKSSGIIQPIIVRKDLLGYEIIAGERRWRAAQAAGLKDVPIIIREANDREAAELSLIENIQREELNPIEEADAYVTLMEKFELSQEDISQRVGKDRSTIANTIRLLKLPEQIKQALMEKIISAGHARCLLALNSTEEQIAALHNIIKKDLNVRETEKLIKKSKKDPAETKHVVTKDRFLSDLEKALSTKLMARVQINGSDKKGLIEIKYTSMDELNRLSGYILDELE